MDEPRSELYQQFEAILNRDDSPIVTRYIEQLHDTADQLPNYEAILTHETAIQNVYKQRMSAAPSELDEIDRQTFLLHDERDNRFDATEYSQVRELNRKLQQLNDKKELTLRADNSDAVAILELINHAPSLHDSEDSQTAPFAAYADNTNEAWSYTPDDQVRQFLDSKTFVAGTEAARNRATGYTLIIDQLKNSAGKKTPIAVPSSIIVNAAGFDSWQGRGFDGEGEKAITSPYSEYNHHTRDTSHTALKHYAGLPSELPPVGVLNVYIQPNGKIFADNGGGDSHRIAAAFLRGNEFIEVETVNVRLLSEDMID